jgi:diguanylate cyclase (GGDEF)-like protein/PAS domain S-box-containing protein
MPIRTSTDRPGVTTPPESSAPEPAGAPASEARLRQVIDALHEGVVIRAASGTIVDVNPAAERMLRRTRAQLIGGSAAHERGGVRTDGSPFPASESAATIALSTGRDVVGQLVGLHIDHGELRWMSVNARAMRDGDVVTGVVTTFADVTEQQSIIVGLADSERRFRLLAENSSDLITSIDPGGVRTYVSPSCRTLLGYEPEELIGKRSIDILHPDDRDHIAQHLQAVREHGPASAEARFRHKTGAWVWLEMRGRAVRDERGNVTEVLAVARDVTERRQAEETLRASEAAAVAARDALATVLDATTQYAIIGTDANGLITVFNGGAERMLGYRAEDLIGQKRPTLFHDPGELARLAAELGVPIERVLGHGTRDKDTDTRDWTLVRSDGVKLPVSLAITAIRAADGTLTGYLGIGRDITAERQAARELRDAEERFRNAFDQAPIGKALVALDGRFTRVNAALGRILGCDEQNLLGISFQSLTHPDDLDADLKQVHRLVTHQSEAYELRKRYRHAAGHYIWALLSVSLVRDEGGEPHYFVAQIQDISEQVLAAERLTDQTLHDPLTGLANRVLFADRLAHAVERSRRSRERIAVLFIDLDRFKSVNDSLGHAAGDELLRQAAERMRRAVRPADTIARLGGDEFTVLCEDLGAINDAGWVADRLSDTLERPFDLFGAEMSIGVSIGIAVADAHDSAETVLAKADAAMYRAKNDRREWQGAA